MAPIIEIVLSYRKSLSLMTVSEFAIWIGSANHIGLGYNRFCARAVKKMQRIAQSVVMLSKFAVINKHKN